MGNVKESLFVVQELSFFFIGFGFFSAELGAKIGVHALSNPRILASTLIFGCWLVAVGKGLKMGKNLRSESQAAGARQGQTSRFCHLHFPGKDLD